MLILFLFGLSNFVKVYGQVKCSNLLLNIKVYPDGELRFIVNGKGEVKSFSGVDRVCYV